MTLPEPLPARAEPAPYQPAFAPAPTPEPDVRAPEPEVRAPAPHAAPPSDLDAMLRESGLVMIETDRAKAPTSEGVEETELPRARRERRPPPADLNQPLVQVETRHSETDASEPPRP